MISLDQVTVSFGSFDLLKQITLLVSPRDRVGLVGRNGSGKTTILRLFMGLMKPSEGVVSVPASIRLGYLAQHMAYSDSTTVFHETEKAFEHADQWSHQSNHPPIQPSRRPSVHSSNHPPAQRPCLDTSFDDDLRGR